MGRSPASTSQDTHVSTLLRYMVSALAVINIVYAVTVLRTQSKPLMMPLVASASVETSLRNFS
jgi:hypothetical protein